MDLNNYKYNEEENLIIDNIGNKYPLRKMVVINNSYYTFNIFKKKNGIFSIYCKKKKKVYTPPYSPSIQVLVDLFHKHIITSEKN